MKHLLKWMGIVGLVGMAAVAWAEPEGAGDAGRPPRRGDAGGPGGFDRGEMLKRVVADPELAKQVGLTGEQVKTLKEGQYAFEKQLVQLRAEAERAKLEVRHLMDNEKVDRAALGKALDEAGAKELALHKATVLHLLDVKETIGPDVMKKIKETVRERMAQRGPGGGPPPGDRPMRPGTRGEGRGPAGGASGGEARPWLQQQMPPPPQT